MKNPLLLLLVLFLSLSTFAQQQIQAKIIDSTSQQPIPYATVTLNKKSGIISNDFGDFQLRIKKKISSSDSIFINCMGFKEKAFSVSKFKDSLIVLNPNVFELNEVLIINKNYTIEEIIDSIQINLAANYKTETLKSKLFYRESDKGEILKSEFNIKNSSIKEFNQAFVDSVIRSIPRKNQEHSEVLASLYTSERIDSVKLDIIKASSLFDKNNELSLEAYEKRINKILKKHVKRDSYFKIKSGIFSTTEQIDSTFFEGESAKKEVNFLEEQEKKELDEKNNYLSYKKNEINDFMNNSFTNKKSTLNFIHKSRKYKYVLDDFTSINDQFVWKINFSPKRGADYKGTLYVNTNDFAVVRVDFENVKNLKTFGLLGISFKYKTHKGILIYERNEGKSYSLKFAESNNNIEFGIKRPLKIVEKNKKVKGRRKQNEISGKLHFIISGNSKRELIVFNNDIIDTTTFNTFEEAAKVTPTYLPKYDPSFWEGHSIIEPNKAIKNFKVLEKEEN